jgi:hypothetical protein
VDHPGPAALPLVPQRAAPAPAPAALQPLLELLERQRHEGDQQVAWINTALRAVYACGRREASTQLLDDIDAELDAEIRHHDHAQIAHRADPDDPDNPQNPPEPIGPLLDEPAWMRAIH